MAFAKRILNYQLSLANGDFGMGGNNAFIEGLRSSCTILNTGGVQSGQAEVAIYGLPIALMNQLATTGAEYLKMYKNTIQIFAGDDQTGTSLIWAGAIVSAVIDAQQQPDVALRIHSLPGAFEAVNPGTPISINGSADVAGMLQKLATAMGMGFENNGVSAKLVNPYYAGSVWSQAISIAQDAGITMVIDRNTMVLLPASGVRSTAPVMVSPSAGMMSYPTFDQTAIEVSALFNPQVKFYGAIQVDSQLTSARGTWKVNRLGYQLESQMPSGRWAMSIRGVQIGPTVP